jgi:hypothetical protein
MDLLSMDLLSMDPLLMDPLLMDPLSMDPLLMDPLLMDPLVIRDSHVIKIRTQLGLFLDHHVIQPFLGRAGKLRETIFQD